MTWYVASIIMSVKTKQAEQREIPVYENFVLIEGRSQEEALQKAIRIGKKDEEYNSDMTLDNQPAKMSFEGIRKLINISNPEPLDLDNDRPDTGTELSYSQYLVRSKNQLKKLVDGKQVTIRYVE